MCPGCVSSFDAVVVNIAGATAAASAGVTKLRNRLRRESATDHRVRSWQRNAEFCRLLDLDPDAVLGSRPVRQLVDST